MSIRLITIIFLITCWSAGAQTTDSLENELKVLGRASPDSIILRWAPVNAESWVKGNKHGYIVERYTLIRDKKLLEAPERILLTPERLKPFAEDRWASMVQADKYAAIAAQALLGDSFELTTEGTDVFQIVNKVKENEMRFSFAMFSADMSVPVSIGLALRMADHNVSVNEKYLYRVSVISELDTIRGSVFIAPEKTLLPQPVDFSASFSGNIVSMKWDQSFHRGIYSAYVIERAEGDTRFAKINEEVLVTLTEHNRPESRFQYATDSVPVPGKAYEYRVRGLTPFGEMGPPSDEVSGTGVPETEDVPHIFFGRSEDNSSVILKWEFPEESEGAIREFEVRRSPSPKARSGRINKNTLIPGTREFIDLSPGQTNYYQVIAMGKDGRELKSPIHYTQLIDSIPPSPPMGLKGMISDSGRVSLSWSPNTEKDIYGYRVYRANNLKEEFAQVTSAPVSRIEFADRVDLNTLNRELHYQIMAIDQSQNHSGLSDILTLKVPDKIKPVAPFFYPVEASEEGVKLSWTRSSSDDVVRYDVYKKGLSSQQWDKIAEVLHGTDTAYVYQDKDGDEGVKAVYTVFAIDEGGLQSDPATPVVGAKIPDPVKPPVVVLKPVIAREEKQIVLKWNYDQAGVAKYQIYRAKEGEPLKLYSTQDASTQEFIDRQLIINTVYNYHVVAMFRSGARSEFGERVVVNY